MEIDTPTTNPTDTPTAEDPFGTTSKRVHTQKASAGPTYEANQGTADQSTGGSTDPHDSLSHADSGNETEEQEGE